MRLRDTKGSALRADRSHVAQQGGHAMRSFDFAPFYRSTVGFDRLFSMLDQVDGVEGSAPSCSTRASPHGTSNVTSNSPTMFRSRVRAWKTGSCTSASYARSQRR